MPNEESGLGAEDKAAARKVKKQRRRKKRKLAKPKRSSATPNYPRHTVEKVLRIPKAIIDQNAGRDCTERESAAYLGISFNGPYR
jgi:hypothetical protein